MARYSGTSVEHVQKDSDWNGNINTEYTHNGWENFKNSITANFKLISLKQVEQVIVMMLAVKLFLYL